MSDTNLSTTTPQFDTAEYAGMPGTDRCKLCNQLIADRYYRINSAMACSSCAERAKREVPVDTHAAYMRGLLYGGGAAVLGLILYSAVGIITGFQIGYVSLAVGYLVGKAMKKGSQGIGGRRYQIAAALLTYAAVSMAAVPIALWQQSKQSRQPAQAQIQPEKQSSTSDNQSARSQAPTPDTKSAQESEPPSSPKMSVAAALGTLVLIGLASPFLELQDPVHGMIGLVILLVGIRFAWQSTAGSQIEIDGPFNNPASKATTATAG
jgi:predicted lipid-binding transport protein (Tim44 family)